MSFKFNPLSGQFDIVGSSSGGGMAIGDTVSGGTSASVLFVDSSGDLAQDNPYLTYDPVQNWFTVSGNAAYEGLISVGKILTRSPDGSTSPIYMLSRNDPYSGDATYGGIFGVYDESTTLIAGMSDSGGFKFGWHDTQTLTTLTTLQGVAIVKDDGTVTHYKPSTDSNANRGAALVTAMAASVAGDSIVIGAGTYQINSTLTPLDNVSISGIGMPTIVTNAFSDGTPAITLTNDNITIQNLNVQSNTTCLGLHSATPTTISNLIIRNVHATVTDTDANALMFSQIHGGGSTEHLVTANIYNCKLHGGTIAGFGSHASLQTGSLMNFYDCDIFGATDGYLHKNSAGTSTGVTNIFGGQAASVLDAVTSGGTGNVINCYGVFADGDQSDFYGDDGTVNIYWCTAAHGPDYIVGNGINTSNISPVVGDVTLIDGEILFTGFGGSSDVGIQRVSATKIKVTDASSGRGDLEVLDEAYGVGWNGSFEVPTKNAVYDKIESLSPGGGGNFEQATLDFGSSASLDYNAVTTVSATWVTSASVILCTPSGTATADHDPEDYILEGITACVTNIVDGVSFDVLAGCPSGTYGDFIINCTGA